MTVVDIATETTLAKAYNDFNLLAKAQPQVGEELRFDDVTGGDLYIGAAVDATLTSAASWKVVRYYRTAGAITRARYRTAVVWDNRTAGWT